MYLRNRYYDTLCGGFITEDPAKDSVNWYAYCGNDPVMFVDPMGLFDYNTKLSYAPQTYNNDVLTLQNELAWKGYLSKENVNGYFDNNTFYWYDPNGNQISSMTVSTGTTGTAAVGIEPAGQSTNSINEYDSWNQLTRTLQNGKTSVYTYNGDGLRMSKTVNGTTTNHIWDGTNIGADVTGSAVTKYVRGMQLIYSKTGRNVRVALLCPKR